MNDNALMDIAKTITPPDWMGGAALHAVMDVLNNGDGFPKAFLVGGCVRNVLVNKPVSDIDIATQHTPGQVTDLLRAAGIKAIPTGIDHGTVTAVVEDAAEGAARSFEVTTLRRDVETDGRRAVVAFTKDWREDAQRRDFTMNTLLCDLEGHIYDPTGQGVDDLEAGRVVFVGDAAQRIAEDYLRVLRFFRFYGRFGKGAPNAEALAACADAAVRVLELSRERITQELFKILFVDKVVDVLRIMQENKILLPLFDQNFKLEVFERLAAVQGQFNAPDVIARLLVLSGFDADYETVRDQYLTLSGAQKKNYAQTLALVINGAELTDKSVKLMVLEYGADIGLHVVLIKYAVKPFDNIEKYVGLVRDWDVPVFPITGADVISMGVENGPIIGDLLEQIRAWWVDHDFAPDRAACLARLSDVLEK